MATGEHACIEDDAPELGTNAFLREQLRSLNTTLHKTNAIQRELLEVLRDLRDEMALARAHRTVTTKGTP